jgi:hypothetical protein
MSTPTIWKTYNGIDVYVDGDGNFTATANGIFLRQSCWEHLRTKIENEMKGASKMLKLALSCVTLIGDADVGTYSIKQLTLAGLNRNDSSFKWAESIGEQNVIYALPSTRKNTRLLEELAIAKSTVRDLETAIKDRIIHQARWGGRIEASKYNEQLENLRERYKYALDASQDACKEPATAEGAATV